jgi:hypothetical protein
MPLHRITGSGESEIEDVYATESASPAAAEIPHPEALLRRAAYLRSGA